MDVYLLCLLLDVTTNRQETFYILRKYLHLHFNTTDWTYIQDLTSTMDSKMQTDIIVLDFAKAFDKVSHPRLLHKLRHYGIKGKNN